MRPSILASAALLLLAIFLFVSSASATSAEAHSDLVVRWCALAAFVTGATWFAVRDFHGFATFVAVLSAVSGAVVWLIAGVSSGPYPPVVTIGGPLCAAGFVAGLGVYLWARFAPDTVPDVLRSRFGHHAIVEKRGVQIVVRGPQTLPLDAIAPVEVFLQNCTGAPRTVHLTFAEAQLRRRNPSLVSRAPSVVELGPSQVKRVCFPVCPAAGARDSVRAYVQIRIAGGWGRRTRHRRAAAYASPPTLWLIVLALLFAAPLGIALVVIDRGGLVIGILPGGRLRNRDELPDPTVEILWTPPLLAAVS